MKDLTVEEICRRINIQANLNDLQSKSIEKRNSALKTLVTITLRALLRRLGFDERIKGDHHIFTKDGVEEILNLQPKDGKGKPYQVKQVRDVILKYHLGIGE